MKLDNPIYTEANHENDHVDILRVDKKTIRCYSIDSSKFQKLFSKSMTIDEVKNIIETHQVCEF